MRELELGANDPTTRELGTRLFQAVEATFDQYTGLRQINDFRGLPDAPFVLAEANQAIGNALCEDCGFYAEFFPIVVIFADLSMDSAIARADAGGGAADAGESGAGGRGASGVRV